jgi:hypothetical protein
VSGSNRQWALATEYVGKTFEAYKGGLEAIAPASNPSEFPWAALRLPPAALAELFVTTKALTASSRYLISSGRLHFQRASLHSMYHNK